MFESVDKVNEEINKICQNFLNSDEIDIDEIINNWDIELYWFNKEKLKQLLTYLAENKLKNFKIKVYPVLNGKYGFTYCSEDRRDKLLICVEKQIKSSGFWLEPECHSPSGGNYEYTRVDIKLN